MMLVDSNIIMYYFNGVQKARDFLNQYAGNMAISTITGRETVPQVFIGGEHIGGSDDLEKYFANKK